MIGDLIGQIIKLISGANARWLEFEDRQTIYFANHRSHLDAFVVWSVLPPRMRKQTRVVGAKDYWEKTALRRLISQKIYHPVLIERNKAAACDDAHHPVHQIIRALDEKSSIIIFPEGTRNAEEGTKPFKSGLYHIAQQRPNVELVPVYLENLNRILPKGEIFFVPLIGAVTFGPRMRIQEGEEKKEFLNRAQQALIKLEAI